MIPALRTIAIRSPKDFCAGLIFLCIGLSALWIGKDYPVGDTVRMGPGLGPRILSFLIIGLGIVIALRGLAVAGEKIDGVAWKPALLVLAGISAFAFLVETAGLLAAIVVLVLVSGAASRELKWNSLLIFGLGLGLFCCLLFITGLGLPISWGLR